VTVKVGVRYRWSLDVYENGLPRPDIQADLMAEFRYRLATAETFKQIGNRIRARYG